MGSQMMKLKNDMLGLVFGSVGDLEFVCEGCFVECDM